MKLLKPNTFIIGAPKCGTSALAHYLSTHPNVFFSNPKEIFYWCKDFASLKHELGIKNIEDYLRLFRDADPERHLVIAEGSTRYLRSENAVRNLLEFNKDSKFIAMVRNPIELAHAYHMEQCYSMHEDIDDFGQAWRMQEQRKLGTNIPKGCREPAFLQYKEVASLGTQIKRLLETVPKEQVLVLVFDDLKTDVSGLYSETLEFLELPNDNKTEFEIVNSAHAHRYQWLAKLILTPPAPLEDAVLRMRRCLWEQRFPFVETIKARLNKKQQRTKIPDKLRLEMQDVFKEEIDLLSKLLDRDLSCWTSDSK